MDRVAAINDGRMEHAAISRNHVRWTTVRAELTDRILIFGERHLQTVRAQCSTH